MALFLSPEPSTQDIIAFMDDDERLHWESRKGTSEERVQFWESLEALWRSIPDPTEEQLRQVMRDEDWQTCQTDARNREGILNFYRRKWKADRKAAAAARQAETEPPPAEPEKGIPLSVEDNLVTPREIRLPLEDALDPVRESSQEVPKDEALPETPKPEPPQSPNWYDIANALANSEFVKFFTPRDDQRKKPEPQSELSPPTPTGDMGDVVNKPQTLISNPDSWAHLVPSPELHRRKEESRELKPFGIKKLFRTIVAKDVALHARIADRFPRLLPLFDSLLSGLFDIFCHPAFAVISAILLFVLSVTGRMRIIVAVSVFVAWLIAVLWIARSKPIKTLSILARLIIVIGAAGVFALAGSSFGYWALSEYHNQQRKPQLSLPEQKTVEPTPPVVNTLTPTPAPKPTATPASASRKPRRVRPRGLGEEEKWILRQLNSNRNAHASIAQHDDQITKEELKSTLSRKLTKKGIRFLIGQIKERGVTFRFTPEVEKEIRDYAKEHGNTTLDALISAVRDFDRVLTSEKAKVEPEILAAWRQDEQYSPGGLNHYITLKVSLVNKGIEVSIKDYQLKLILGDESRPGVREGLTDLQLRKIMVPRLPRQVKEDLDDLYSHRLKPLSHNGYDEGYLRFRVKGGFPQGHPLGQTVPLPGARIKLIVVDVLGDSYIVESELAPLLNKAEGVIIPKSP